MCSDCSFLVDRIECSGGDRLRGITSTFILAVLSQRQFRIDMPYPCPLEKVLQPNLYDWQDQFSTSDNRHVLNIEIMQDRQMAKQIYEKIASKDFLSEWSSYDDIYLTSNSDYITPVLTNPHLQDRVRWLNLSSDEMSQTQLFPLIYEILFRPTDVLMDLVDGILTRSDREKVKDLICLHFRIGMNPSMIEDQSFSYRDTMVDDILAFLNRNMTIDDQSLIFVTSDSAAINQHVLDHFGPERSVSLPGPIIHIDRLSSIHSSTEQCQGFLKVLADFYVLGECDRLIMARSGFSHWASRRRLMTKQFDELYLYCRGVHRVTGHGWKRPHSVC